MTYWPGTNIPKSENNAFTWRFQNQRPVEPKKLQTYKPGKPITLKDKK